MSSDLEAALAHVEALIDEGEQRIRRQRKLVAALSRKGADTELAARLLANFDNLQQTQLAKRDDLLSRWYRSRRLSSSRA